MVESPLPTTAAIFQRFYLSLLAELAIFEPFDSPLRIVSQDIRNFTNVHQMKNTCKYFFYIGIRDRMAERCNQLKDVSRQHEQNCDKAVDDLVTSQSGI